VWVALLQGAQEIGDVGNQPPMIPAAGMPRQQLAMHHELSIAWPTYCNACICPNSLRGPLSHTRRAATLGIMPSPGSQNTSVQKPQAR
jgi:hypothetical protein